MCIQIIKIRGIMFYLILTLEDGNSLSICRMKVKQQGCTVDLCWESVFVWSLLMSVFLAFICVLTCVSFILCFAVLDTWLPSLQLAFLSEITAATLTHDV